MTYHRILHLPPHEADPVQIIAAAYLQLRRWRNGELDVPASERQRRVRLIIGARDAMLRHVLDDRRSTRRSRRALRRLVHSRSAVSAAGDLPSSPAARVKTLEQGAIDDVE